MRMRRFVVCFCFYCAVTTSVCMLLLRGGRLQGNWWPSFMLMSMYHDGADGEPVVELNVCRMPSQMVLLVWYGVAAALSVLALVLGAVADFQDGGCAACVVVSLCPGVT